MDELLITDELLASLHEKAIKSERLRANYDLRNSADDTSQRMLNVLELGTEVPIHKHENTNETVICINGCLKWVFYEESENGFRETSSFRVCPKDGVYGIQVPIGVWHTVVVLEPSVIFEAKDGAYIR